MEIREVVKARSPSAPVPSGVPYSVYKRCPRLLQLFWKMLNVIWRRGRDADQRRFTEGVWIAKEENSRDLDLFRSISLLYTESKIFFCILSRRVRRFFLVNNYIDTSVEKGRIPDYFECLEHNGVVTQILREAKKGRGDHATL